MHKQDIDIAIDCFCESMGVNRDDVMDRVGSADVCRTRYMIYAYLHNNCGIVGHRLADMFQRDRINILRGIRVLKGHMKFDKELKRKYFEIVEKIEGGN